MPRKFVIATDVLTQQQERELGSFLSEYGTWWHWLSNIWLLRSERDDVSAIKIRAKISEISGESNVMVLEINGVLNYSGLVPKSTAKQSRSWIARYFFDSPEWADQGEPKGE